MSQIQADAIRRWWAARKAAGWTPPIPKESKEQRRAKDRERQRCRRQDAVTRAAILSTQRAKYVVQSEEILARNKANRAKNVDAYRATERARYHRTRDRRRELARLRHAANPDRVNASNKRWRDKNRERLNANAMKRHALKLKTQTGPVDYAAVIVASKGVCGICQQPVDLVVRKNYNIDHIIPLARGGTHTQDNLQLAHKVCNVRKWAHLPNTGAAAAMGGAGGMLQ